MQNDPTEQQQQRDTGNGNPPPSRQSVPVEKDPVDKPADQK